MKERDLVKIEERLMERKAVLEKELALLQESKKVDGDVQDTGDQVLSAELENVTLSFQDNEFQEYKMILKALERIKKGDYGLCTDCGQMISEKRLSSYPNATRCVVCQEAAEESGILPGRF